MRITATLIAILWCLTIPFGQDAPGQNGKAPKDFCKGAQSQVELNECSAAAYRDADQELNAFYSSVRKKLDQPDVTRLQDAQRAWITYRDKNCEADSGLRWRVHTALNLLQLHGASDAIAHRGAARHLRHRESVKLLLRTNHVRRGV
jgi:uncharacterized protein YecT (DUF1311 family)